jgi:hypothetical protein
MRAGQEREIYSNLLGDRQELHSSTLVSPTRSKGRGQKKVVWRGLVREIQKRKAYPFLF